jgi:hypothetical protein
MAGKLCRVCDQIQVRGGLRPTSRNFGRGGTAASFTQLLEGPEPVESHAEETSDTVMIYVSCNSEYVLITILECYRFPDVASNM